METVTSYQDAVFDRARRIDAAIDRLGAILMRLTEAPNGSRVGLLFPTWPEAMRTVNYLTHGGFEFNEERALLYNRETGNLPIQIITADDYHKWLSMFFESAAAIGEFDTDSLRLLATKVRPMDGSAPKMYWVPKGVTASFEVVNELTPLP